MLTFYPQAISIIIKSIRPQGPIVGPHIEVRSPPTSSYMTIRHLFYYNKGKRVTLYCIGLQEVLYEAKEVIPLWNIEMFSEWRLRKNWQSWLFIFALSLPRCQNCDATFVFICVSLCICVKCYSERKHWHQNLHFHLYLYFNLSFCQTCNAYVLILS